MKNSQPKQTELNSYTYNINTNFTIISFILFNFQFKLSKIKGKQTRRRLLHSSPKFLVLLDLLTV